MYKKIDVLERLPELMKFVTTIDSSNEHRVFRLTKEGWNMRDADGDNSPNNNLRITHWLEEFDDSENLGRAIDRICNLSEAINLDLPLHIHVDQLRKSLPEVARELKAGFVEVTGHNPWEFET
jgi:hypothetical protein